MIYYQMAFDRSDHHVYDNVCHNIVIMSKIFTHKLEDRLSDSRFSSWVCSQTELSQNCGVTKRPEKKYILNKIDELFGLT